MTKIPKVLYGILESTPDVLHGAVRFVGTRVQVEVFLDTIAGGWSVDRTLESLPTISRDQALAVLEWQNSRSKKAIGLDRAS